jgi:hypothetical protein
MNAVITGVPENASFRVLDACQCQVRCCDEDFLTGLCVRLAHVPASEELDLSGNSLASGGQSLVQLLPMLTALQLLRLYLRNCAMRTCLLKGGFLHVQLPLSECFAAWASLSRPQECEHSFETLVRGSQVGLSLALGRVYDSP